MLGYAIFALMVALVFYAIGRSMQEEDGREKSRPVNKSAIGMSLLGLLLLRLGIGRLIPYLSHMAILSAFLRQIMGESRATDYKSAESSAGNVMDKQEAARILGVAEDAPEDAIKEAHKRLMQRNHPDTGGNDYIASKINQARDVMLRDRKDT